MSKSSIYEKFPFYGGINGTEKPYFYSCHSAINMILLHLSSLCLSPSLYVLSFDSDV